jgi:hypothetical protein
MSEVPYGLAWRFNRAILVTSSVIEKPCLRAITAYKRQMHWTMFF